MGQIDIHQPRTTSLTRIELALAVAAQEAFEVYTVLGYVRGIAVCNIAKLFQLHFDVLRTRSKPKQPRPAEPRAHDNTREHVGWNAKAGSQGKSGKPLIAAPWGVVRIS